MKKHHDMSLNVPTPDTVQPGAVLHQYLRHDREFGCNVYTVLEGNRWRLEPSWLDDEAHIVEPLPEIWTRGRLHWPQDHEDADV